MKSLPSFPTIALIGRQNVGKSSIFNRLTRTKSALVANFPGLTRDYREGKCDINNQILNVIDTGGLSKNSEDFISNKVNEKTLKLINLVNVFILFFTVLLGKPSQLSASINSIRLGEKAPFFNLTYV